MIMFFRVARWLVVAAAILFLVIIASALSWLLIVIIHANTHAGSLLHSVLIFCALVVCAALALAMAHGINEGRHGK